MTNDLEKRRINATPAGLSMLCDIYVDKVKNSEIFDIHGRRYIDFAAGTSVMNVGHSHPRVVAAVTKQIQQFSHTFFQQLPYESYIQVAEYLNAAVPGDFEKKTALFTDGATAVENAIKIAKAYTGRNGVISFHGGYHGRTMLTLSLAGKVKPYRNNFGTPVGEVYQVPFPSEIDGIKFSDMTESFERLFKHVASPESIATIIVEPVQGEGGFRPATTEMMLYLRTLCNRNGIVLIADEVQTGFCRTGKLFAMEHFGVAADITAMSKSIAAGIPMSAVTGKKEIMDSLGAGGLGGTFGGNPLGCAAALAVFDIIREENLAERSVLLGTKLSAHLNKLSGMYTGITNVRGIGSMMAIELTDMATTKSLQKIAREKGLFLLSCGVNNNVIRFLYPLTIELDMFDEALAILSISCEQLWN